MRFPAAVDKPVAEALRALPGITPVSRPRDLFARAEVHGVVGVLWDAWRAVGADIDSDLAARLDAAAVARELDHEAHLDTLRRIDQHLEVSAVALKGPLFARRYYPRPSSRGTSDVDLLVGEEDLERAVRSLAAVGYEVVDSEEEVAWARREHHHLHLSRPHSPELELHFHAYRGFGVTLRTETLRDRSAPAEGFRRLRVPAPEDELVYLSAHAAAHRFGRLAWLYDIRLVVDRMSPASLATASARAAAWGFSRVLALTAELLVSVLGVPPEQTRPLGRLPKGRRAIVNAVVTEPKARALAAASRFAYTTMLADSLAGSLRYASRSSAAHARRILGIE